MLLTLCTKRVLRDVDPTFEDSSPRKHPVAFNPSRFDGVGLTKNTIAAWTNPRRHNTANVSPFHPGYVSLLCLMYPTSPRASQSMSFAEVGLNGRCAEGLFNAEHSTAECLWKCRWIYGRGICYTITLSHLRFFHFTPGYTQELWAAMLENKIAVSKREQSWASVSNREQGPKRYV